MDTQAFVVARDAFAQLNLVCQLCLFLQMSALDILIHTLVMYYLDYGNRLTLEFVYKL